MERWHGKVAVITGASAGIGAGIARKLVENGLQVVGLARRLDKLQELQKDVENLAGRFHPIQADVTQEEDILKAIAWIKANLGGLQIWINNAGVCKTGDLLDSDTRIFKSTLDTNVLALTVATREAVKVMREKNEEGHVIQINSTAGHRVLDIPLMNVYFASKHAVTALAESLRLELAREKINVRLTSISPGLVDTDILAVFQKSEVLANAIKVAPKLTSEDIANAVVYVLGTPPHVQVTELTIQPTNQIV